MPKTTPTEARDITIAVIDERTKNIDIKVDNIQQRLEKDYVTQDQFDPIKRIVYGLVGLILVSVVVALLAVVLQK